MSCRFSFQSRLSSIMETMAKSALTQVCKLVDEDSAEIKMELSRLLSANSALAKKVNSLECELIVVKSEPPKLRACRSVGIQTDCYRDEDVHCGSGDVAIERIFGNDWCMNLWKDRDPHSLQTCAGSPQSFDKSISLVTDDITRPENKAEDCVQNVANYFPQQMHTTEEHKQDMAEEPEQLSVSYSVDKSNSGLSFDQSREQVAVGPEEAAVELLAFNNTEETFSAHIIPVEEEEDDDDVQFVQETQQEQAENTSAALNHDNLLPLAINSAENFTAPEKDSNDSADVFSVKTTKTNEDKFSCKICCRTFFHKGTLTRHMKSHKSNFCNICMQHFPQKIKLNSHSCVPPQISQRISKSCLVCGKTFANPSALRIHYVVHTGEKPHRCNHCGKRFTQKGNLKCHLRIHTGERPFRCVKCGRTFTQKVNLNHHLMAHLNREVVDDRNAEDIKNMSVDV